MKSTRELTGQRFHRLVVIECAGKDKKRNVLWKCVCDCGNTVITRGSSLVIGMTKSCGCLLKDSPAKLAAYAAHGSKVKTHGMSRTPTWSSWNMMMQRCFNPNRKEFKDYGERGIKPCEFIKKTPANVVAAIGERPGLHLTIDRIGVNGGYTCGQCQECKANGWKMNIQWGTRKQQNRNRRDTVVVLHNGEWKTRSQVAEETGMTYWEVRGAFQSRKRHENP